MEDIVLTPAASGGDLIAHGLADNSPILISIHSSARMKLLGNKLGGFDPLSDEVRPRIALAARRAFETEAAQPTAIVITALDLE